MTTFYEYIKAASSLSVGTVWDLISHPKTGGTNPGTIIYVEQIATTFSDDTVQAVLQDETIHTRTNDDTINSTVTAVDAQTNLSDNTISTETQ
jgi:hypothetical protein